MGELSSDKTTSELAEADGGFLKLVQSYDLENSLPFDPALKLSSKYDGQVDDLARYVVNNSQLRAQPGTIAQIRRTTSTLLANLFRANQKHPECFLAVSLSPRGYSRDRYNAEGIGYDNLMRVLDVFRAERFFLEFGGYQNRLTQHRRTTRLFPTPRLIGSFSAAHDLAPTILDVNVSENFECIRLKDKNKRRRTYEDDDQTKQMRDRLTSWNRFLEQQWVDLWATDGDFKSLKFAPPDVEITDSKKKERGYPGVDLSRRTLYRIFNNDSFEEGGRLYGGWWQQIPAPWRTNITINGHACRELDYSNFQPAMLYAKAGEKLEGYAYELEGLELNERNKAAVKATMFKLIYSKGRFSPLGEEDLPEGWSWKQLLNAVEKRHTPIKTFFRSGIALKMQREDSEIAQDVMLSMMKRNVLVLPVHDSFVVPSGCYLTLRDEMERAYRTAMGSDIHIKLALSYLDRQPPPTDTAEAASTTFEDFDAALQEDDRGEEGPYRAYFMRQRIFRSRQPREYFIRFEPY